MTALTPAQRQDTAAYLAARCIGLSVDSAAELVRTLQTARAERDATDVARQLFAPAEKVEALSQ
jgi:hypothetical protein